jgi:tRNA pseudouridine55 synthase
MPFDFIKGELLLIDKALDWTSFDVVNKVRIELKHHLGLRLKVGHAGTLDPKATGLLIICTGGMTKKINEYMDLGKEYTGTFVIGATTPSFDTETEITVTSGISHIREEMILGAARKFTGDILQVPPVFSAKKIDGKRAYEYARRERELVMAPVPVTVAGFEITGIDLPEVHFRIRCGKGTYIRALARDFGEELGTGAYLSALRRTRIGNFDVRDSVPVDRFTEKYLL